MEAVIISIVIIFLINESLFWARNSNPRNLTRYWIHEKGESQKMFVRYVNDCFVNDR